ncbi:MAG: aminopeptidase P family protein [Dehalococcoidales bacterium]|nr:aminopeptidase P family protein [Dehalococcoidales bacterium]
MKTNNRIDKLRQKLTEKGIDAIMISQPENRYYLSGFNGSAGFLFITQKEAIIATDFRYVECVKRQSPDFTLFQITGSMDKWFQEITGGLSIKMLAFEAADLSFERYQNIFDIINDNKLPFQLIPLTETVESIRSIKEPGEISLITQAANIGDIAFKHITDIIHTGMTELEIAWELEKSMRNGGSQSMSFEIIVGSGPNAALPHSQPSRRIVKEGEPIVIDFGAKVNGYCSDITRTICLGKADEIFNCIYRIVLDAQLAAISKITSGTTGAQADSFARSIIEQSGYGENFGHGLGHSLGLAPHEKPNLNKISADVFTDNMVFTVEPGIYIPGWGGVRIEDTVIIKNGKINVLSHSLK